VFEELLRDWDGEEVVVRFDAPSGAWMFVGVHSTVLGPGMGGTRMKVYDAPEDGLRDVLRLSGAMTLKNAAADVPFGGGKAVLAVPEIPAGKDRRRLLQAHGKLIASLGGTYVTAGDMNIEEADLAVIGEVCPYVLGRAPEDGGSGDSGPATARGVLHGIRACLRRAFGSGDLAGRSVLVQGAGAVGRPLAVHLAGAGAKVLVADVHDDRADRAASEAGGEAVPADEALGIDCDVFAPCATGAVLSERSIPQLACRIVAGSANNQLATEADAQRIEDAGILYAPDFVINAGGVLHLACLETLGTSEAVLEDRLEGIAGALDAVFAAAGSEGITTHAAARRIAEARIESARAPATS
jgi:leucine dehydrogenase